MLNFKFNNISVKFLAFFTSEMVKSLSFDVSPTPSLRLALTACRISSEPRSQQGVVVHTYAGKLLGG